MVTERERFDAFANRLAGWGLVALTIPMWWWDYNWPSWVVGIINPVLVIGVVWGFSRWKRCTLSRVLFWAVLGIYAVSLIIGIATAFHGFQVASGWYTTAGLAVLGIIWALWRMPKVHAAVPDVSHIVHHHVLHHPDGRAVEVGQSGMALPDSVPAELDAAAWPAAGQRRPIALENFANRPGLLDHGLPARLREVIRRRA